jgi:oxalate decarboxylase/phosphoglucose isomerase-like protein (cupin superfamily)
MTGVIRPDDVTPVVAEGPFGHLDVRWLVSDEATGSQQIAFGQTIYEGAASGAGATHELHYHPNAEEIVLVTAGRAEQIVGDETLELGPGDVCFIPSGVPHRISAVSDEQLVILWALSAASIEAAGYVSVEDAAS